MRRRRVRGAAAAIWLAAALAGCSRGTQAVNEPHENPGEQGNPQTGSSGDGPHAGCTSEIALSCPQGKEDGCNRKTDDGAPLTAYHVCVPDSEQASQPCAQEIARECDEGLVDACLVDPPAATTHICVQAPAATEPPVESPGSPGEPPVESPGSPGAAPVEAPGSAGNG